MIGNMPQSSIDEMFVIDGWKFYIGTAGDEFYTEKKLVVEFVKGGGIVDGDPRQAGQTWKSLAEKQVETGAGDKLSEQQRLEFAKQFVQLANDAIVKWSNGTVTPPKNFFEWLVQYFRQSVRFDSTTKKLVIV